MAKFNTVEDFDIVLEGANNIHKVSYNGDQWEIEYKNGWPSDYFDTCREMMEFLIADNSD